jgi:hypothetical protein
MRGRYFANMGDLTKTPYRGADLNSSLSIAEAQRLQHSQPAMHQARAVRSVMLQQTPSRNQPQASCKHSPDLGLTAPSPDRFVAFADKPRCFRARQDFMRIIDPINRLDTSNLFGNRRQRLCNGQLVAHDDSS